MGERRGGAESADALTVSALTVANLEHTWRQRIANKRNETGRQPEVLEVAPAALDTYRAMKPVGPTTPVILDGVRIHVRKRGWRETWDSDE